MKFSSFRIFAALLFSSLMLASCSSHDNALESVIPADAQLVVNINVEKIASELNISIKDGAVVLPPELNSSLSGQQLKSLATFAQAIDLDNCNAYMLAFSDGNPMAVASVKDAAKFQELLSANQFEKQESISGFDVYAQGSSLVIVRNDVIWVPSIQSSPEQAVEKIKTDLKLAEERSIADVECVNKHFAQENLLNLAINNSWLAGEKPEKDGGVWSLTGISVKDNELVFTSANQWADASPFTVKGFTDINASVLQYVPANASMAFAAGLSNQIDWNAMLKPMLSMANLGLGQQAQMQLAVEYLKMLDGTIMGAAAVDGPWAMDTFNSPQSLNFILMAHMDQKNLDGTLASLSALASQSGMPVADEGNNLRSVSVNGMTIYFGATDGYLTIASRKPSPNQGNAALTANFNGKQQAFALSIPSLAIFNPALNFGLEMRSEGTTSEGKATLAFPGSDKPVLASLIRIFAGK